LGALLDGEGLTRDVELSLVLCEDEFIRQLNRDYRGRDRPTDVLSFPQDAAGGGLLGDVVISLPTAERQAAARGQSLEREVAWLFLHGALHLLGYGDETREGAAAMDRRARAALEAADC